MGGGRLQELVAHGGSTEVVFPFDISSPHTFLTGKVCKVLNWSEVGQNFWPVWFHFYAVVLTLEPCKVLHNLRRESLELSYAHLWSRCVIQDDSFFLSSLFWTLFMERRWRVRTPRNNFPQSFQDTFQLTFWPWAPRHIFLRSLSINSFACLISVYK